MRLSEAMALGRTVYTPCRGGGHAGEGKGCALEMALAAVGRADLAWSRAYEVWSWLGHHAFAPICQIPVKFDAKVMIEGSWSMDQFVDWVRSIEPPEEPERSTEEFWSEAGVTVYDSLAAKQAESK